MVGDQPRTVSASAALKAFCVSGMGTALEFHDFVIYGMAAALAFPQVFFPSLDRLTATPVAFGAHGNLAGFAWRIPFWLGELLLCTGVAFGDITLAYVGSTFSFHAAAPFELHSPGTPACRQRVMLASRSSQTTP